MFIEEEQDLYKIIYGTFVILNGGKNLIRSELSSHSTEITALLSLVQMCINWLRIVQ